MKKIFAFLLVMICLMSVLCGCAEEESMTDEQRAEYRASFISEYEVCSVTQYIKSKTNNFGGVIKQELCYAFTYIKSDGTLGTVDDFTQKVCIGESNKYVIDTYGDTRYLYLTTETLKSISNITVD